MPATKSVQSPDDKIYLLDYVIVLAKHSRKIIYASVAVTLLTYLILFCLPNKYTATTKVLPPAYKSTLSAQVLSSLKLSPEIGGPLGGGIGAGMAAMLGLKSPGELFVGILKGTTISDKIISRFNLREVYGAKAIEDVRKTLNKNTVIIAERDGLISVAVTDKRPKRAAEMANAFVEELNKLMAQISKNEAKVHLDFLEKERDETGNNLSKAEEALRSFSEKSNVVLLEDQTKGMLKYIATLRATIDAKDVEISVMRKHATPFNSEVIRLETELNGLKEKLKETESNSQACVGDVCLPTSKVPTLGLQYFRLIRETKYQETLYQLYCKLVEMARLDMVRDLDTVPIVDQAKVPEKKSNKRVPPSLLAGVLTCFLLLVWAFIKENYAQAQTREEDLKRLLILSTYLQPYKSMLIRIKNLTKFRGRS